MRASWYNAWSACSAERSKYHVVCCNCACNFTFEGLACQAGCRPGLSSNTLTSMTA